MIKRISKLHNIGVFRDFVSNTNKTADFKKFNAIYGWNGSGKTTLSRVLSVLETGTLGELDLEDSSNATIVTSNGNVVITKESVPTANPDIKVFNEDFVNDNLDWSKYKARPILIVSKEKIEQKENLTDLRGKKQKAVQELGKVDAALEVLEKDKTRTLEKARNAVKEELASYEAIKPRSGNATLYRNYTITDVGTLFSQENLIFPQFTDEEKLSKKEALSERVEKDRLNDYATDLNWVNNFISAAEEIANVSLSQMAGSSLESEVGDDEELREWLRAGHLLHRDSPKPVVCQFCRNEVPETRLQDLDKYFDKALRDLLEKIESTLQQIEGKSLPVPESNEKLYKEFEKEYATAKEAFFIEKINLESRIESIRTILLKRKKHPFERSDIDANTFRATVVALTASISGLNSVIAKHNDKTDQFTQKRIEAAHDLELYLVGQHKADFDEVTRSIEARNAEAAIFKTELNAIAAAERDLEESLRDHKIGAVEFNNLLKSFLGREEIKFSAVEGGYSISRGDKPAKHLSEGERNAIALIFFLMKLQEDGFNPLSSVIVIDDPVSSFDSQHIYQAYGFIKARIKELNPQQFFLLTHNFHFYRQFRTWYGHEKRQKGQKDCAGLYILKCKSKEGGRFATIENIDPLLEQHNSEYTFLFKLIYERAKSETDPPLERDYVSPNNLRKLLENYLSIKVPYGGIDIHGKFLKLLEDYPEYKIGATAKGRIEAYCQDNSHPLYQDSPNDFDERLLGELESACSDVIALMEGTDPKHFKHLLDQITPEE